MKLSVHKEIIVIALLAMLLSCGGGGGSVINSTPNTDTPVIPFINATLISFPSGTPPAYEQNAYVSVLDQANIDMTTATVTFNDTLLTYTTSSGGSGYVGKVVVAPGETIVLEVIVQGSTYTASATQFASYPTPSFSSGGTLHSAIPNRIEWSGGSPTDNAVYNLAIHDAHNPEGNIVWPTGTNNLYHVIPINWGPRYTITENSISIGDRLLLAAIVSSVPIPKARYGSTLVFAGGNYVPITVVDSPLASIEVTPADPNIPKGLDQQFFATAVFADNDRTDVTAQAAWSSSDQRAIYYGIPGLVRAANTGSATIQASFMGVSGTSSLTVTPAILQSLLILPDKPTIVKNGSKQFRAYGKYTDGSQQDYNALITWSSSNADVATISNVAGSKGLATPVASGTTTIDAAYDTFSALTVLTVSDWTDRGNTGGDPRRIVWDGRQFLVLGGGNGSFSYSSDGINWQSRSTGITAPLNDVIWTGSQYVMVGGYYTVCCYSRILTSPDGIVWTERTSGTYALQSVAWSGTQFVAVGDEGAVITSPDGITWTVRSSGTTERLFSVVWSGTRFIAAGRSHLFSSDDGITWTARSAIDMLSVASSGSRLVAVGRGIVSSEDGLTWTPRAAYSSMNAVIWTGQKFIAVGWDGMIVESTDGITWSPVIAGFSDTMTLWGIAWSGSNYVIIGYNGQMFTSP